MVSDVVMGTIVVEIYVVVVYVEDEPSKSRVVEIVLDLEVAEVVVVSSYEIDLVKVSYCFVSF